MSEARKAFADVVNRVAYGSERFAVVRHGRELAAIVPIADLRRFEEIEANAGQAVHAAPTAGSAAPSRPRKGPRP